MVLDIFAKTLNSVWPMIAIFLCVLITSRIAYLILHHKKITIYKEIFALIFIIYMLLLFELLTATDTNSMHGVNLTPFAEISRYQFGSRLFNINVFGNILIFIPFGMFIAAYINTKKVYPVFMVALFTSTVVELVQLRIGRSFDIDDILLNVVGSVLGYILYSLLKSLKRKMPRALKSDIFLNLISIVIFFLLIYWLSVRIGII
ncbi:MAG: VanZ family protein [Bacilli bacterium]|nr:VanZ family protein [Bacilli bacterium]